MGHIKWTEIENFHSLRKSLQKYPELLGSLPPKVTYRAKVKLHGTNAGVMVKSNGEVTALSRTHIISPGSDNAGFARWVEDRRELFAARAHSGTEETLVFHGEWVGPGIQKGVAVNSLKEKVFALFSLRILVAGEEIMFIDDPSMLAEYAALFPGSYAIPWFHDGEEFTVDWSAPAEGLQPALDEINRCVLEVEACDPWVKENFGIEGVGEGLVFYPKLSLRHHNYSMFTNLVFKAKGEKHQTVAHTKPAQADASSAGSLAAFAELVLPLPRLEQWARFVNNGEPTFSVRSIGAFLKHINDDLFKETSAELEASGLPAKEAYRACSEKARNWYVTEAKKL